MFHELTFTIGTPDAHAAYLGGTPYLPESIAWPVDASGAPLLHLASLPAPFINRYLPGTLPRDELVVSVFTPYALTSDDYIDAALNDGGVALAYRPAAAPRAPEGETPIEPRLIEVVENPAEDSAENGIAKIAGIPAWLQDEDEREGLRYVLQINNSRLNKAAPTHRGILVGGAGYLLLKNGIADDDQEVGLFVIQAT